MSKAANPFSALAKALLVSPEAAAPKLRVTPSTRVFISGQRVRNVREVDVLLGAHDRDSEPSEGGKAKRSAVLEAKALKARIQQTQKASTYQRARQNPDFLAKRETASRSYYAAHRDEQCAARRDYYQQHAEAERARTRAYYAANREQILARAAAKKKAALDAKTNLQDLPEYCALSSYLNSKAAI